MKNNSALDDMFINNLPTLDLHGETRDSAKMLVKEFIEDNYVLKNNKIVIIHGVGKGIIKDEVMMCLRKNKLIEEYHLNHYNSGCTLVYLKNKKI